MFWILAIVGLAAPWSCEWIGEFGLFTSTSTCTVDSIYDGDTMRLTCGGGEGQGPALLHRRTGDEAKAMGQGEPGLPSEYTPKRVELIRRDKDRYGRIVGEVIAGDPDGNDRESLNLAQVASGHAAVYPKYCNDGRFYQAQRRRRIPLTGSGRSRASIKPRGDSGIDGIGELVITRANRVPQKTTPPRANKLNDENIIVIGDVHETGPSSHRSETPDRLRRDEIQRIIARHGQRI